MTDLSLSWSYLQIIGCFSKNWRFLQKLEVSSKIGGFSKYWWILKKTGNFSKNWLFHQKMAVSSKDWSFLQKNWSYFENIDLSSKNEENHFQAHYLLDTLAITNHLRCITYQNPFLCKHCIWDYGLYSKRWKKVIYSRMPKRNCKRAVLRRFFMLFISLPTSAQCRVNSCTV